MTLWRQISATTCYQKQN